MLLEKINADLKEALKAKKEAEIGTLRMLLSSIKNEEISKRPHALTEADIETMVKRETKKLKDAISDFELGGRQDLAEQYRQEIKVLDKYLPEQVGEDEVRAVVKKKISSPSVKDFGSIMKEVMAELKGKADGSTVSRIVKEEIEK